MTKKLELSFDDYLKLFDYAKSLGLEVYVTPFDLESVKFLESINLSNWKIPSGEITNLPFLERIGKYKVPNKQIVLATGMSLIEEIKEAISILNKTQKNDIIILHCNTEYPTPDYDVNVSALDDIKKHFIDFKIGLSDHSVGSIAGIMAVPYGIVMIEKHFTLDKNLEGPDHLASATPKELKELVKSIRRAEVMLGNSKKIVTSSEKKNMVIARKSIVAYKDIKQGEVFSEDNITCKRPGNGISPMRWYDILGKKASKDYMEDELIEEEI
jgi:N-acetylneuraminate synthase